jgi:photosystem II stability/assembly factor-like uncharacterized protein
MASPHRVYVGTIGEGLFRSVDSGETFARACEGTFVECHVRALAVHPRDDRIMYMGSELGLFRSEDHAGFWTRVDSPLNGKQIWSILIPANNPDTIVVGTCPARLFASTDAGRSWHEGTTTIVQECPRIMHTRVTSLMSDPDDREALWAGVEIDGLHRSRDQGRTWQRVGQGLSSQDIHALAKVPRGNFLAATNNDLNLSTDGGLTWRGLGIGSSMPWNYCRTLAQLAGRPDHLFLGNGNAPPGTAGIVGRSTDGGKTWSPARFPGQANSTIWNFACHPSDPSLVYASSVSGQLYRSTDAGESWQKLPREFGEIRALAWTP